MKNKFLLSNSGIIILICLIILPIICIIISTILAKDASILFALTLLLIFCLILFVYRKTVFNLMLNFLKENKDTRKIANDYKTNIGFKLSTKNKKILLQYKTYFKDKITNLYSLPNYYQNVLLQ